MAAADLGFAHRFIPGAPDKPALLLLHGTGGDENDLLPLGEALLPGAARLSPRGKVLENGMPRFFRRLAEGVFDIEDLRKRTHELADFVPISSRPRAKPTTWASAAPLPWGSPTGRTSQRQCCFCDPACWTEHS
jgi:phospholipase/carboxylesterase